MADQWPTFVCSTCARAFTRCPYVDLPALDLKFCSRDCYAAYARLR